jgi:hypothetical protein
MGECSAEISGKDSNSTQEIEPLNEQKGGAFEWDSGGYDLKVIVEEAYDAMGPVSGSSIVCLWD